MKAALCLALALLPAGTALPEDPADVLRAADRAFFQDTRAKGLEGWLAWFAEDAVVFPPAGPLAAGSAAIRRHYEGESGFPPKGFLWEPDAASIATTGDMGWTIGRWGNDASGKPVWTGKYITVWRKQAEGGWKVVADCAYDPGYDKRLNGLSSAPRSHFRECEHSFRSASGELEVTAGSWLAIDETSHESGGKYLNIWRRHADGGLQLVADTGLLQAVR